MKSETPHSEADTRVVPEFDRPLQARHKAIQAAAYRKAERRGFAPGHELEDWLAAEKEVDEASKPFP